MDVSALHCLDKVPFMQSFFALKSGWRKSQHASPNPSSKDKCRQLSKHKGMLNVRAAREVIADVCAHKKELETTKSVLMDVGDNFMIMISNQELQVAFGKFCILYPGFRSPMRDKQNKYE